MAIHKRNNTFGNHYEIKLTPLRPFWILLCFLVFPTVLFSQSNGKKRYMSPWEVIDSLFIDHDLENYSLRLFSDYKVKSFKLTHDDFKTRYVPKNRFNLGLGIANSKAMLDVGFNIRNGNREVTKRFDLQGSFIIRKRHYINGYLQIYNGYNNKNDLGEIPRFRRDVKSRTIGFNYLYTFSDIEFSYTLLKAGLPKFHKNVYVTGGVGTFAVFDYFSSDGNILPPEVTNDLNEELKIKRYNGRAAGLMVGLLSAFVLPENIIVTFTTMPGIALINKKVTLENDSYRPKDPWLYKLDASLAASYSFKRYYATLSYETGVYSTDFSDYKYTFNLSTAKLTLGYKLKY